MPIIVPPIGPLDAKIILVGEAPGAEEERQGRPFVGGSGQLLDQLLRKAGINRYECYITNVCKIRPQNNDFSTLYEDPKKRSTPTPLLRQSLATLHSELSTLRPNVIVPLGGEALRAVANKFGISKWRGSIISSPFGKCVPTLHPAYLLRSFSECGIALLDLVRAREQSRFPEIRDLGLDLEIRPTFERTIEFLQEILRTKKRISVDIETTKKPIHIRCLGIGDSSRHALCIPFVSRVTGPSNIVQLDPVQTEWRNHWTEEQELEILGLLDQILGDPLIPKVFQNGPFDTQCIMREFGIETRGIILDTMAAMFCMYPEMPKDLGFAASVYTEIPYYSDFDHDDDTQEWTYNLKDCVVTFQTAEVIEKDLAGRSAIPPGLSAEGGTRRSFTSADFYHHHLHPAFVTMCRVGQRGVLQDLDERARLLAKFTSEMDEYRAKFNETVRPLLPSGVTEINPGSPKQLKDLFYRYLKFRPEINHKTKKETTDEDAVEALAKKHPEYIILFNNLLHWRKRQKIRSTYLQCTLTKDNRLVTSYNAVGTVGGRCSSSETVFGEGANHQNFPNRKWIDLLKQEHDLGSPLRKMFIADPDHVLIKTDLSQAQFRIAVWDAPVVRLIERYSKDPNFDVHKWVASLIYKVQESLVTTTQRSVAKNGVYGGNFGMEAKKAALTYGLSLSDAEFVLREYRRALPEIPLWWEKVKKILLACRTLISPLGRIRVFHDRLDDATFRDAYAHICQAVEADIIHRAAMIIETGVLRRCETVMQIHDELVLQCHTSTLNENLPKIKRIMEYPVFFPGVSQPLIIPAEISYGHSWGGTTKWDGSSQVVL